MVSVLRNLFSSQIKEKPDLASLSRKNSSSSSYSDHNIGKESTSNAPILPIVKKGSASSQEKNLSDNQAKHKSKRRRKWTNGLKEKRDRNLPLELPEIEEMVSLAYPTIGFSISQIGEDESDVFSNMTRSEVLDTISTLSFEDMFDPKIVPRKWRIIALEDDRCRAKIGEKCEEGLPPGLRGEVWSLLIKSLPTQITRVPAYEELKEEKSDYSDQILRDVGRTFPTNFFFNFPDVKHTLYNILNANATFNKNIGYCQGMGSVAAVLMFHLTEEDAFWAMTRICTTEFSSMWMTEMPGITKAFFILTSLLQSEFPKLQAHLASCDAELSSFTTPWFITGFLHNFPLDISVRIWDVLLFEGYYFIYAIALSIFKIFEEKLLAEDFDGIVSFLNFRDSQRPVVDAHTLLETANTLKPKIKSMMPQLEQQYQLLGRRHTL